MAETIIINSKKYTSADDIRELCPIWCKGVRSGRKIIEKKNIPDDQYIYARFDGEQWIESEGISVKYDKVFIRNMYLNKIEQYVNEINDSSNVVDDDNVEKAPPLIALEEHEMFHDNEGYPLQIEARGQRQHDKIYFRVKDVAEQFVIRKLQDTLLHINTHITNLIVNFLHKIINDIKTTWS